MFEIDKKEFGLFVAVHRKEKGLTQKELAAQLFVSDKAVSKWETGVSLPDTALLIPLADLLGISVTELLTCKEMPRKNAMEADRVEDIVKAAITYADENSKRAYQVKKEWIALYGLSLFAGCIGTFLNVLAEPHGSKVLITTMLLCSVFGAYFCCFVKTKLPAFYDENDVNFFCDGVFRMNMPGIRFTNSNWPHIIKAARICMCSLMILFPMISLVIVRTAPNQTAVRNYIFPVIFFCGFLFPVYWAGKK